eukprot:NODE_487_length_6903_cov_0.412111.p3 type:complete len:181 gc:universal NODE_487_length_6903_cov_0.412111:3977-4519(+)
MKLVTFISILYIGFSIIFTTIWTGIWILYPGNLNLSSEIEARKLFTPMLPTTISPNYYKGTEISGISIATMITLERLPRLKILVENYKGPISCVLHIENEEQLTELHKMSFTQQELSRLYLHVIMDNFDRQFNLWRNVAKFYAPSDVILMLDIDFYLPNVNEMMHSVDFKAVAEGNLILI